MTVIANVYWDLVRIYDSNSGYGDRMRISAQKLAQFLPFSPLYPDIVKKAQQFQRSAKNPHVVREFLKMCRSTKGPCFIATAVFADEPQAWELFVLRRFRDEVLKASPLGRQLVMLYYTFSPPIAESLRHSIFRHPAKKMITLFSKVIRKIL